LSRTLILLCILSLHCPGYKTNSEVRLAKSSNFRHNVSLLLVLYFFVLLFRLPCGL